MNNGRYTPAELTEAATKAMNEASRDYPPVGISLLRTLGHMLHQVARDAEVVGRLPRTADGEIVECGNIVYHPDWDYPSYMVALSMDCAIARGCDHSNDWNNLPDDCEFVGAGDYYEDDTGAAGSMVVPLSECYSTEAAAEAAAKEAQR